MAITPLLVLGLGKVGERMAHLLATTTGRLFLDQRP